MISGVDRILKRDQMSLDENTVTVEELSSPKLPDVYGAVEPKMVYICGDISKLSKQALVLYLEEITDARVLEVKYGTKEDMALVLFKDSYGMLMMLLFKGK